MNVIKRDGREVEFDKSKIFDAVYKAMLEVDKVIPQENMVENASEIANKLEAKYSRMRRALTVEEIQDDVEKCLMRARLYDVAKAYIT